MRIVKDNVKNNGIKYEYLAFGERQAIVQII